MEVITQTCNATFCDSRCTLLAANFTYGGEVTAISVSATTNVFLTDLAGFADDVFRVGVISFLTGANANSSFDIKKSYANGSIQLYNQTPYNIAVGDTFSIIEGCNKTIETCVARNNVDNFRGFPTVPNPDKAFRIYSE